MDKEFSFINLFRALAALWVIAAHCMIWGGWYGLPLPSAKIAVDLFMVISGFLMAANGNSRLSTEPLDVPQNWIRFWARRYFRLAPAYYIELGLAVLFAAPFLEGYFQLQQLNPNQWGDGGVYDPRTINYSASNILLHLSFLFGLHPRYSFSTFLPDWSLSLEMQFYLAFPFIFILAKRFGIVLISLWLGICMFVLGRSLSHFITWFEPSLLIFKLNYFLAGMTLFTSIHLLQHQIVKRRIAVVCALLLATLDMRYEIQVLVLPLLLCGMFYIGWNEKTRHNPSWLSKLLESRILHFLSDASYSAYLFHGFFISASGLIIRSNPFLIALTPQSRVLLMFCFVVLGTYTCAYITHRWIELPGIKMGRVFINRHWPIKLNRIHIA